jgi:Tfp pilus assembly protein PilV
MATLRCEIYEPPKKRMPFLAVGAIGASLQFAHAARTREQAQQLLDGELERMRERAELHAAYGARK